MPAPTQGTQAHHVGSLVWAPERSGVDAQGNKKTAGWVKGRVVAERRDAAGSVVLEVQTDTGKQLLKPAECPLQNERDDTVDDLVKSDFLHEPGCCSLTMTAGVTPACDASPWQGMGSLPCRLIH
jgi:hypothetical protein